MELRSKFTEECDKYLTQTYKDLQAQGYGYTYFHLDGEYAESGGLPMNLPFRYPGATRGHVTLDKQGCISSVVFYETDVGAGVGVYEKGIKALEQEAIGWKVI